MNNKEILIHVGLPKTATKFKQHIVFPKISEYYYIDNINNDYFNTPFWFYTKDLFKKKSERSINILKKDFENYFKTINNNKILWSSESITSRYIYSSNENLLDQLKEFKSIFPNTKIFIVLRKQDSWIESFYKQMVAKQKKEVKFKDFFIFDKMTKPKSKNYITLDKLNWLEMVEAYQSVFGKENVFTLPYEMLKNSPDQFFERFFNFFHINKIPIDYEYKVNTTGEFENTCIKRLSLLTKYDFAARSIKNQSIKNLILKHDKGFKNFLKYVSSKLVYKKYFNYEEQKLSEQQKEFLYNYYKVSNENLSQLLGINLQEYNYY